jgi:hypothetical protein
MQGTFSLSFKVEGDHKLYALDWSLRKTRRWSVSRRAGVGWDPRGPISEKERLILLERFGLGLLREELPLEEIIRLGPQALIRKRRELEERYGLERLEVKSDTLGYEVEADHYAD